MSHKGKRHTEEAKAKISESMKGNDNTLKWTEQKSIELFEKALQLAKEKTDYVINGQKVKGYAYHFIGEIISHDDIDEYSELFTYLKDNYESCRILYNKLKIKLEKNCFSDSKRGLIREATAIINLKANYGWKDRVDSTSDDKPIKQESVKIVFGNRNGD